MADENSGMKTVRCRNPKNGVVYVYSYENFYDEAQGKYRQRRRCIGKVDPVTGAVVDTQPRGSSRKKQSSGLRAHPEKEGKNGAEATAPLLLRIEELEAENKKLEAELKEAHEALHNLRTSINRLNRAIKAIRAAIDNC